MKKSVKAVAVIGSLALALSFFGCKSTGGKADAAAADETPVEAEDEVADEEAEAEDEVADEEAEAEDEVADEEAEAEDEVADEEAEAEDEVAEEEDAE